MGTVAGRVDSLWRYPVKSMGGEELGEAFVGFAGVYGDRLYAFESPDRPAGFPWFTGRDRSAMLRYRPRFRHPERAAGPRNLAAAESVGSGATPIYGDEEDLRLDVETPTGDLVPVDDSALARELGGERTLRLLRSDRALTDCRPLSLISLQTVGRLGQAIASTLDKRRFRANIYADLESVDDSAEDAFVGKTIRIGAKTTISVLGRDSRCKMITLDPDTGESSPEILREVARSRSGMLGVYAAVLVEGIVRRGDPIELLG